MTIFRLSSWWLAGNILFALALSPLLINELAKVRERLDSDPVYTLLRPPVATPATISSDDPIRVAWFGYYRRDCPGLAYARVLILETAEGDVEIEKILKPASSAKATKPALSVWQWKPVSDMPPGTYRWRSVEHAECRKGIVHVNTLADTTFTVQE